MDRQLLYRSRGAGTKRERWGLLVVAAGLALAMAATPAASQESGTVTGVVTDEATGQLLEGTRVTYDGGAQRALATQNGRYVLANIPAGTHTLTFELIGYETVAVEVDVAGGATTARDISMVAGAIRMQDLVVSGVARATPQSKLPIVVEKLDAEDLPVPALSTESLLAAKLPGVKVVRGSGQPGASGDILLRGATSISGSQAALFVVDGVISGTSLDDISALDIESVEVVKGAAGASLYGSRAANGVIVIRTKRGGGFAGQDYSRIVVRNEAGGDQLPGSIQLSNYHPWCVVESGQYAGYLCDTSGDAIPDFLDSTAAKPALDGESTAEAFQDNEWPAHMDRYDHVDRIYTIGMSMTNYAATEGRDGNTSYRASVERNEQQGVLSRWNDGFQRRGFRLNLDHEVRDYLSISVSTAYNHLDQEDIGGSPFFHLTFMGPYVDLLARDSATLDVSYCPDSGCFHYNPDPLSNQAHPLYDLELHDYRDKQENQRASANLVWRPYSWMDLEGTFGIDKNWTRQNNIRPEGLITPDGDPRLGSLFKDQRIATRYNSDVTLSTSRAFGDIATRTRLRYLQELEDAEYVRVEGTDFIAENIHRIGNTEDVAGDSWFTTVRAEGVFLISGLEYQGKYIFDGVVRWDRSSLFGPDERNQVYWRTAGAWRLDEEPWWPLASVDQMKLRAAVGTAGRRPAFWHQYEAYNVDPGGLITPTTLGNSKLRPQRSTELEAGVDLFMFNRIAAEVTYAATTSKDQILSVPLPAPFGFDRQIQNAGTMSNNTWELSVSAPIISTRDLEWDFRLNFDRTRQQIDSLGPPPYKSPSEFFFYRTGEKFGSFYGQVWATGCEGLPRFNEDASTQRNICESFFAVNDDGLLVYTGGYRVTDGISGLLWGTDTTFIVNYVTDVDRDSTASIVYEWGMPIPVYGQDPTETRRTCDYRIEAEAGCGDIQYMGNTTPDFNVSLANTFRWRGLELYVLLDGEIGAQIYNQTRQWAYREGRSGDQDQAGKDEQFKKPIRYYEKLYNANGPSSWFVEAGDFVKVREVSLSHSVSPRLLDSYFGGRVSQLEFMLIGRNLLTFTNYKGYDPEVGSSRDGDGGSQVVGRVDNYQYPNYRTLSASVRLVF